MDVDTLSICLKNFYNSETELNKTHYNLSIRIVEGKSEYADNYNIRSRVIYFLLEYVDSKCGLAQMNDTSDSSSQRLLDSTRLVLSGWMTLITTILGVMGNLLSIMTLLNRQIF